MVRGGHSHLGQILLLAGNFEMILRYSAIRSSLAKRVKQYSRHFKSFVTDSANYWPLWKLKERDDTNFEKELQQ